MKPALLSLTFLFFAFPLAYGQVQQVADIDGNPVFPGVEYFTGKIPDLNNGVKLGQTGNSTCPVTVQVYESDVSLVKSSIAGGEVRTGEIFQGTPLDIELTNTRNCAESTKWTVFVDNDIQNMDVGIGGLKDQPGQEPGLIGTFSTVRNKLANKFVYCSPILVEGAPTCYDIGKYHEPYAERASRLILTEPSKHKAFEFVLIKASNSYSRIKTVV